MPQHDSIAADRPNPLIGQRFGKLVVLEYLGGNRYRCACDCGGSSTPNRANLKAGRSRSCGCQGREASQRSIALNKRAPRPLAERFWEKVEKTEGCWLWRGSLNSHGYGQISVAPSKPEAAYRVSYRLHFGQIPKGLHVLHRCDNKLCVRPDHLHLGSHQQNMQEAKERGRMARGEARPQARLTTEQIMAIRSSGERDAALAAKYGVCSRYIRSIKARKAWSHVG